jgi:hypothetical protein
MTKFHWFHVDGRPGRRQSDKFNFFFVKITKKIFSRQADQNELCFNRNGQLDVRKTEKTKWPWNKNTILFYP